MKHHIADQNTLVHFVVGLGAGLGGVDPKVALLAALLAEGAYEVVRHRSSSVLFERDDGSSKAAEILNLLSIVFGAHLGEYVRAEWVKKQAPAAAPAPAVAPAVSPQVAAGLGLVLLRP